MSSLTMRGSIGIAAAASLAMGVFAAPAVADTNASNVDGGHATSLTITKCEQTNTNGVNAGSGNATDKPADCTPIAGIEYTITKLDYDLTRQDSWKALATAAGSSNNVAAAVQGHTTGTTVSKTTDSSGVATFADSDTDVAAYLVQETRTSGATINGQAAKGIVPSADFIVTLPMTNPSDTSQWNYDVSVFPKNAVDAIKKTVSDADSASGAGNALTYTINSTIPKIDVASGDTIKRYQVIDRLDPRVQTGTGADQLNPRVSIVGKAGGAEESLSEGTDYTITVKASTTPGETYNYLTVDLTETGRAKIAAARAESGATNDTQVKVVLTATFAKGTDLAGGIENTGYVIPSDSTTMTWDKDNPGTPDPDIPSTDSIKSKYGSLVLTKTGTDAKAASTYQGAKFQVYTCSYDGTNRATLTDSDGNSANGTTPLTIDKETTFTTGADGTVKIASLRANDWENGKEKALDASNWYCLVETQAPSGYTLQSEPQPFRILSSDADLKKDTAQTVTDVPESAGFRLPLTGAKGVLFLTIAGGLLILGGATIALVNRRRQRQG